MKRNRKNTKHDGIEKDPSLRHLSAQTHTGDGSKVYEKSAWKAEGLSIIMVHVFESLSASFSRCPGSPCLMHHGS